MRKLIKWMFKGVIQQEAERISQERVITRTKEFESTLKKEYPEVKIQIISLEKELSVAESLGISAETKQRLDKLITKSINTNCSITEKMEMLTKNCVHPNQSAYCNYILGAHSTYKRTSLISGLLGGLLSGGMEPPTPPEDF